MKVFYTEEEGAHMLQLPQKFHLLVITDDNGEMLFAIRNNNPLDISNMDKKIHEERCPIRLQTVDNIYK